MHYKNAKKFEEKKASIYLCPVVKGTPLFYYFCDSWPVFVFSTLCELTSENFHFFSKTIFEKKFFLQFLVFEVFCERNWFPESYGWVAVNRSNFSGREDRGLTFPSNCRDRMECGRILSYLLYGSVASLPSPSSNIEASPYGTSLRFASLLHSGH